MRKLGIIFSSIMLCSSFSSGAVGLQESVPPRLCELRPPWLSSDSERTLTVAVIDTGLDTGNSFFGDRLWTNPGESGIDAFGRDKATNGIDDDGNGLVDDVHGWNFASNDGDIGDPVGHGTHIAGLVLNSGNEILSVQNLSARKDLRLMVLKYHDGINVQTRGRAFHQALQYAYDQRADLVHISGGGFRPQAQERALLEKLERRGVPVIVASGNKKPEQEHSAFYPSAYGLKNLISVSAVAEDGLELLTTSNETPGLHCLREKGAALASFLPGNRIGRLTGTSQAAARLTGRLMDLWRSCAE